ncbi:ATP-grasp domain-containing protein [Tomitella biformata]|uniref:ATP-grasp domain-containing protein n=1 Tax=Tomitella biformata TaxID=630403 RepID=UPI000465D7BC|nr:ATP-grasp domain-containing protein [Tomitella biformata]
MSNQGGKNILITFGRSFLTLDIARLMGAGGHTVFVADSVRFPISRYSNSVTKAFRVARPKFEPVEWARDIARIVREQHIDLVITVHEETDILAQVVRRYPDLFPDSCQLFLSDFESEVRLHNKYEFQVLLDSLGVDTMKFARVSSQEELEALDFTVPFALKQCYSRGSQDVHKVYPGNLPDVTFDPGNPWIAQEWIKGKNYCSYSICRNGEVLAHTLYPVNYAIDGHSCLDYAHVEHEAIAQWVRDRVKAINFTGQIGFDFIDVPDGRLLTIECNPRATSGIMLFEANNQIDRAFFGTNDTVVTPNPGVRKMVGPGMLMYGWRKSARGGHTMREFIRDVLRTDEVITQRNDLKPAFAMPLAMVSILREAVRYKVGIPEAFMHDHEWDGHPLPK